MVESGGGKASARCGGNGAPLQLRAQLHRLVVEQILQEHASILNDTSCSVDESTKVTFMNKCIEHMKEVRMRCSHNCTLCLVNIMCLA